MSTYRFFEILPGALAWTTLILMVALSRIFPASMAVFIILFDLYWLLKTMYLSFHLRSTFNVMNKNLKINWLKKLSDPEFENCPALRNPSKGEKLSRFAGSSGGGKIGNWRDMYHLVVFPMYREPYEVARESFERLTRSNYPKEKFIVVLGIEERAGAEAKAVAEKIEKEFGNQFFRFLISAHPSGLPGEIPGKGSNETWAARRAKEIIDTLKIDYKNILVSVFDIDTQVFPEYFGRLTYVFLHAEHPLRAIYQPVPLFVNNIFKAPALARVIAFSSTFWQMMQQSRPERLTSFSSQSVPFPVLADIGFWDTGIVSEDSRIFWQGYLRYHGDFRVEPLFYPVSMDANVAPTFWQTMRNNYKQHRRWGWGVENIPYMLEGFRNDPAISRRKKWYWSFHTIEGFWSWATNSLMIFALGWLPVVLGGREFNHTILSYSLPQAARFIIQLSMIGIASSAILGILLLPPRPPGLGRWHYALYLLQWALIPVTLIAFGSIPGLEAQTRLMLGGKWRLGFWVTPKSREL